MQDFCPLWATASSFELLRPLLLTQNEPTFEKLVNYGSFPEFFGSAAFLFLIHTSVVLGALSPVFGHLHACV